MLTGNGRNILYDKGGGDILPAHQPVLFCLRSILLCPGKYVGHNRFIEYCSNAISKNGCLVVAPLSFPGGRHGNGDNTVDFVYPSALQQQAAGLFAEVQCDILAPVIFELVNEVLQESGPGIVIGRHGVLYVSPSSEDPVHRIIVVKMETGDRQFSQTAKAQYIFCMLQLITAAITGERIKYMQKG